MLRSCLLENAISLPEEKLDDLTLVLFQSADKDNSGSITFQELKEELERFPEVMENLTIRYLDLQSAIYCHAFSKLIHDCGTIGNTDCFVFDTPCYLLLGNININS